MIMTERNLNSGGERYCSAPLLSALYEWSRASGAVTGESGFSRRPLGRG
jgi:hypothetical protein